MALGLNGGPVMGNAGTTESHLPPQSYASRHSGSSPFISDLSNDEDQASETKPAEVTASQTRAGVSESQTLRVLSITRSISHGSVTSRGTNGCKVSKAAQVSTTTDHIGGDAQALPVQVQPPDAVSLPILPTPTSPQTPNLPKNIKEISTEMPPQYWAGRFVALHDHFHNELLEPDHLALICETRTQSPLPDLTSASAAARNNPSTSIYAITRSSVTRTHLLGQTNFARQPSRIPQSATSGAILQSTPYNVQPSHYRLPSLGNPSIDLSGNHPATSSSTSFTTARSAHSTVQHPRLFPSTAATNENSIPKLTHHHHHPKPPTTTTTTTSSASTTRYSRPKEGGEDDDRARTRRVLAHLEALCTTPAALGSLRAWQAAYARATGQGWIARSLPPSYSWHSFEWRRMGGDRAGFASAGVSGGGGGYGYGSGRGRDKEVGLGMGKGGGRKDWVAQEGKGEEKTKDPDGGDKYDGVRKKLEEKRKKYEEMRRKYEEKTKELQQRKEEVLRRYEAGVGKHGYGKGPPSTGDDGRAGKDEEENGDDQHHSYHEFGRRGREMVRRLRRGLVRHRDGRVHDAHIGKQGAEDGYDKGCHGHDGDGYMADGESLAVEEKEKGRRLFSFF